MLHFVTDYQHYIYMFKHYDVCLESALNKAETNYNCKIAVFDKTSIALPLSIHWVDSDTIAGIGARDLAGTYIKDFKGISVESHEYSLSPKNGIKVAFFVKECFIVVR